MELIENTISNKLSHLFHEASQKVGKSGKGASLREASVLFFYRKYAHLFVFAYEKFVFRNNLTPVNII